MDKIVIEGIPEASHEVGMRAFILTVYNDAVYNDKSKEIPRVFVRVQSWEECGKESSSDCEAWHPELKPLKGKKLRVTIEEVA